MRGRSRTVDMVERFGLLAVLIAVIATFATTQTATFWSKAFFRNVGGNEAVLAIAALGVMLPLIAGNIDLSVGANVGICSIASAAVVTRFHAGWGTAVLVTILLGSGIGLVNGIVVSRLRTNSFIVTLGTATIIAGVVQWYTKGRSILGTFPRTFTHLATGTWLGVPRPVFYVVALALVLWYLLEHTPYGRYLYSIGSNREAARLVGLRVERLELGAFVMAGATAAIAGVIQTARLGNGSPQPSVATLVLPALAAVFVGATVFQPGRFNVWGTLTAVVVVRLLVYGLELSGVAPWVEQIVTGGALVVAVVASSLLTRHRTGG